MNSTGTSHIKEVPLVGKLNFADSVPLIVPGPDDQYAKSLDQLEQFHRESERLRDFA
ncbi:hypothetical protein [uncultured Nocardioides sp.]|uniref:hypothetical protein n=1 Tax=uncultured Nocardioides sp. TaxID=198441 RepID=UPI00260880E5|nr:hypothetical protein [uncultured Nocardioides sp.]